MKNPFQRPSPAPSSAPVAKARAPRAKTPSGADVSRRRPLVFDACQVGVVLRAVLFVELVVAVGALYGANSPLQWLAMLAMLTGGALPATLVWLITACSLKTWLQRLRTAHQYAAGVLLGALAGLYACAMLQYGGIAERMPWLAGAASGALLAAMLVAALVLRARGRTPADTTARLAELQSRIRPHFLFNTLNSAIALVRDEPAKAESLLEDLSDLFRHALVEQGESVTLADEIRLARRYLGIEEVRFGWRLRVQWSLDPAADAARLPPLLLQPLVENAVKHGVEPHPDGGRVRVQTEVRGSRVIVRITNTLPPAAHPDQPDGAAPNAQPTRGHGIALANVRARLALLHDVDSDFTAGPHGRLYRVQLTLPLPDARSRATPAQDGPGLRADSIPGSTGSIPSSTSSSSQAQAALPHSLAHAVSHHEHPHR